MPPLDHLPSDSEMLVVLDAVDATLAGEPVDPKHAEWAELSLLLASERPAIPNAFAEGLDRAVERRFAPAPGRPARSARARSRRWWVWTPALGIAAALITAVVIVVGGGGGRQPVNVNTFAASAPGVPAPSAGSVKSAPVPSAGSAKSTPLADAGQARSAHAPSAGPARSAPAPSAGSASSAGALAASSPRAGSSASAAASGASASGGSSGNFFASPGSPAVTLQPPNNGRKIVQGAQLSLSTAPSRIDQVAQEVFVVVGQVGGIVSSSNVTASSGPGGYAQFQLSIPSSALPQAMASLSSLRYARVASRTDTTQDVNDQYQGDVRALADARALRTSLLKQLANATTQAQIDSLTARIHDAEASISSDEATLRGLNRQIDYSQVSVNINGGPVPVPVASSHGGFGVGQAAHDAGRVLTVAAGIALIAAAALVPLALLAGLVWWGASALRRRRREHALDLV